MKKNIGISLGNIKNLRDGLGEFSVQLCSRIFQSAQHLREKYSAELFFHVDQSLEGFLGDGAKYIVANRLQRYANIQKEKFFIWHSLNQLNKIKPPLFAAKKIITVHDLNFIYFKSGYSYWRDLFKVKKILHRYDEVTTISKYVRADIEKIMGWSRPIEVIYSGARNLANERQVIPDMQCENFLFHLSRMAESKNVKAIINLAKHWPEMNFILAGPESDDADSVRQHCNNLPNVKIFTNITDGQKAWFYAHCKGFVFPSLTEGFGLPPLEAMHFGKPVFLSNLTSLPEIGGTAAWYFQDFSQDHMKAVIQSGLSEGEGKSKTIQAHAAKFNWDDCAAQYIKIYEKHLGGA